MPIFEVHGISFERSGNCTQCGGCDRECLDCPHGERRDDGKVYCSIYETREEICNYCTDDSSSSWHGGGKPVTHGVCVRFPDHPFLHVITSGECSYEFTPATENDRAKYRALPWH